MRFRGNLKYSILFQVGKVYAISRQLFLVGIKMCDSFILFLLPWLFLISGVLPLELQ